MMKSLCRLLRNKKGATAVEYGIMAAAIAAAVAFTVSEIRDPVKNAFVDASKSMSVEENE